MKNLLYVLLLTVFFSCGNDKVVLLPEINHSEITKILDVSPGYLFYDETKTDSVELNRKNLISTTNWLINVDKRLTLKQVIPHIKYLQVKKANSSHKKEGVKNYFTCNNTSKKNLGFIDFTDVVYIEMTKKDSFPKLTRSEKINQYVITLNGQNGAIRNAVENLITKNSDKSHLSESFKNLIKNKHSITELILKFNENITFQEYINFKSILLKKDIDNVIISKNEYIFN
ncbi:hypothetical protein AAFN75_02050 [Algibacter sp. AS12]|uniref:hypothetical protein n=1 Tax=Algibacter sp. AS12 TaxID=3135773 RepID=UPI00398AD3DF